jgi:hypothetical protein
MKKDQLKATDAMSFDMKKGQSESVTLHYNMHLRLYSKSGKLKAERIIKNTVTTTGKAGIADQLLASPSLNKPTHMAVGTGSPAANALGAEVGRVAFTTKTRSGAVVTMVGDFPAGTGTGALTEAGIFDAGATGNTYTTASFSVVNKAAGDALTITWTLTVA